MIYRNLQNRILEDLSAFRILHIKGARQSGKTTIVKQLNKNDNFKYFTFDNVQDLDFAKKVPTDFVSLADNQTIIIDEIQIMPEILPYIKMQVDKNNRPGQFIITGSADLLKMAKVSESLAGRSVDYELSTFSIAELYGTKYNIIDLLTTGNFDQYYGHTLQSGANVVFDHAIKGGFPAVQNLTTRQRKNWFRAYILSRVIKDLDNISLGGLQKLDLLPKMMNYLAWQTGDLLNYSSISKNIGMDLKTVKSYVKFYDTLFLAKVLSPYFVNIGKRIIKTPKFYYFDSGLLSYFLNVDSLPHKTYTGKIIENFVYSELLKNNTTAENEVNFYFYRDKSMYEIDIILDIGQGNLIAIEIKAKESLKKQDFYGIQKLRRLIGKKLKKAYIFYLGKLLYPTEIKDNFKVTALPMSVLKSLEMS